MVINPMATTIGEAFKKVIKRIGSRVRRDVKKVEDLVAIIAKINKEQRSRRVKGGGQLVIAEPVDVMMAIDLIEAVLPSMMAGVETRLERAYEKLREAETEFESVGYPEFAKIMGEPQYKAERYLKSMVVRGLAEEYMDGKRKYFTAIPFEDIKLELDESKLQKKYDEWMEKNENKFMD